MRPAAACVLAMALFGLIVGVVGCEQMPTGPSLTNIVLSGFTKQATLEPPDNSLCCCRAIGSVTNRNTVPVYVSVTLTAVDTRGQNLSSVLFFVPDVAPGQTAQVSFWVHAYQTVLPGSFGASEPVTLRALVYFESPSGQFHQVLQKVLSQFENQ